jgi:subtilisin family serine protease
MDNRLRRFLSLLVLVAFAVFSLPTGFLAEVSRPDSFAAADAAYWAQVAASQSPAGGSPVVLPSSTLSTDTDLGTASTSGTSAPAYLAVFASTSSSEAVLAALEGTPYRMLGPSSARTFRVTPADPAAFRIHAGAILRSFEPDGLVELADSGSRIIAAPSLPSLPSGLDGTEPQSIAVNDPLASQQWALGDLRLYDAWAWSQGSDTVKVAVIDTGLYRSHEDFAGAQILAGWDFVSKTTVIADRQGHGTMTAGVIAATPDNAKGIAGVCFDVTLVPYQVFQYEGADAGYAYDSDIIDAIRMAADSGCRVINLSLGGPTYNTAVNSAVQYAIGKGCLVIAAAGNSSNSTLQYPASYPGVVSVAAHDSTGSRSSFSTYNSLVDVSAPGSAVEVPNKSGGYELANGTSFASPYVAGVAALAAALDHALTLDVFTTALQATSVDKGTAGFDPYYGYGNVDADALLGWIATGGSAIPTPPVSENLSPYVAYSNPMPPFLYSDNLRYYAYSSDAYDFVPGTSGVYNFDSLSETGDTDLTIRDMTNGGSVVEESLDEFQFHLAATLVQGHSYRFEMAYYFVPYSVWNSNLPTTLQFTITPPSLLDSRGVVVDGFGDGVVDSALSREFFTTPAGAGDKVLLVDPAYDDDPYTVSINADPFLSTTGGCFFLFPLPTGQSSILLEATNKHAYSAYHLIFEELATITTTTGNTESLLAGDYLTGATFTPSTSGTYRFSSTQADATIQFCDLDGTGTVTSYLSSSCDVALTAGNHYDFFVFTDGTALSQTLSVRGLSSVATLSALAVSIGSLSPSFAAGTTGYVLELGSSKSSVTLTPTRTSVSSTFFIDGARVDSVDVDPVPGTIQEVQIQVVAEDGVTQTVYTVSVHRPADATALLGVTGGTYLSVHSPPAVLAATLPHTTTTLAFEASPGAVWALFSDAACLSPVNAATPGLVDGMNAYYVRVTAENGVDATVWQVLLDRLPAGASGPLAALRDIKGRPVANAGTAVSDLYLLAFGHGPFTLETTLNGVPVDHALTDPFTVNGAYSVTVTDALTATTTVTFTLAKVYPQVTGVVDGTTYHAPVTIHFDAGEATLDGDPFANDTSVSSLGDHVLRVTNSDGNTTTVHFTIVVSEMSSTEFTCNATSGFVSRIGAGTTVQTLLDGLDQGAYVQVTSGGVPVPATSPVGTGMVLKLMDGGTVLQSLTVVVTGDVNGDGKINLTDFVRLKSHLMGKTTMSGAFWKAGDVNGDGKVNLTDFVRLKSHLMGKTTLVPIAY